MSKTFHSFDLAIPLRDPLSHPHLLDFTGEVLANLLNLTDPDPRRKCVQMVPPKRQPHMSAEMMAIINQMAEKPKGRGTRFDSPSRLRSIFFILKSAQCRLCARGRDHEELLLSYLTSRSSFGLIGSSVSTAEEKHRTKFRGIEFLETAKCARSLVIDILAEAFGPAATTSWSSTEMVAHVRSFTQVADDIYHEAMSEPLAVDVFAGFFDFRHHSDAQVLATVESVARLAQPRDSSYTVSAISDLITFSADIEPAVASYLPPQFRN